VLLYELLTGTTPLERTRLREAALDEMVRLIKEEEAPRPSLRLSSSNDLPKIAAARKTEPARLSKLVRGEIDWIVMKCLEKDRSRRYETANGVARDLERYLADEPVEACPPSSSYRLRKFARKHKKSLATAAAFAVLLVAGVMMSTLLAVRANRQRIAAEVAGQEANRQRIAAEAAKQEAGEAKVEADKQRDEARLTAYASGIGLAQRAWEENNVVRARELLVEVPKEAAGRNLRGFEWSYLTRLTHPDERTLVGHAGWVSSVAFSPDGQRLASASADKTVKIWDIATGKEQLALKGHDGLVRSVAFSPDGQRLASASDDKTVKIWDSATGNELLALKGHDGWVNSVAFSPDGQRLASGSWDETVKIWDIATRKKLFALKGNAGGVHSVAFSPDGQRLASPGFDQTVKIWDIATGKEQFTLKGHTDWVNSVAFSPDGQRLASASSDQTVKIWDSASGKEQFALKGHTARVSSVAFSPDGQRLASASADHTVRIWDIATGQELFALKGHANSVYSVAFSPDGQRLASASQDGSIHLWETTSVSPELQHRRATNQMVADLFREMPLCAEVLEQLRTLPGMSPSRKQEAIAAAQTYPENPNKLNYLAWELVKLPGGEMTGYRKALRFSEEACQLEPENGNLLNTLGVAYYCVGNYEKALDVLSRSDKINALRYKGSRPSDLAFLAMAHQQLGHGKEAQAELERLRERMKDLRWAQDAQSQGFLREAEELLAKSKTPGSP
jgi:WD40 repeat protein